VVMHTISREAYHLSATQRLRLKHSLEPECGFRVGFLGLLLLSWSLVFRFHRVPIRHHKYSPQKADSFLPAGVAGNPLLPELYSFVVLAEKS